MKRILIYCCCYKFQLMMFKSQKKITCRNCDIYYFRHSLFNETINKCQQIWKIIQCSYCVQLSDTNHSSLCNCCPEEAYYKWMFFKSRICLWGSDRSAMQSQPYSYLKKKQRILFIITFTIIKQHIVVGGPVVQPIEKLSPSLCCHAGRSCLAAPLLSQTAPYHWSSLSLLCSN